MFKGYSFVIKSNPKLARSVVEHGGTVLEAPNEGCILVTNGKFKKSIKVKENTTNNWHVNSAWVLNCIKNGIFEPSTGYITHQAPNHTLIHDEVFDEVFDYIPMNKRYKTT